jgi:glycosyltransferase involved in cell wall biosynthesis
MTLALTVWMNAPSFYQDDLFGALVDSGEVDLRVIFARSLGQDRRELGWRVREPRYPVEFVGGGVRAPLWLLRRAREQRERLHLVNGLWGEPTFTIAIVLLARLGSRLAVYSEAPDPQRRRSLLKQSVQHGFGRWAARHLSCVFAVSQRARSYYETLGLPSSRVYPFAYFRDAPVGTESTDCHEPAELLYVGRLVPRKGVEVLLEAVTPVFRRVPGARLSIVGTGPLRSELESRAARLGISDRVAFVGSVPSDQIWPRLAKAAALILPSWWDGWGLVVNEAMSVGVPAIVSDHCGAADLVKHGVNGFVFPAGDAIELREALVRVLEQPVEARETMRANALATGRSLSAGKAARYLVKCLRHATALHASERPRTPWLTEPHELLA